MFNWTPSGTRLTLPLICAPMFIVSGPELVVAQCKAGVVGSFPALNARPSGVLDEWLARIHEELRAHDAAHPERPAAPFAVNLIVHKSNARLDEDLAACVRHRVPIVITSLGARADVNAAIHAYGGIVLHDVTNIAHAHKAVERGADGLIAVAVGAGGHAGVLSPLALIQEIREWWNGPLLLSGAIATGRSLLAARIMGADLGYAGSCFIAAREANADPAYKDMIVGGCAADILYTDAFSGISGNYLRPSIIGAGLDPDKLPPRTESPTVGADTPKTWRDIWGAGQGIGAVKAVEPVSAIVARMVADYEDALRAACALAR